MNKDMNMNLNVINVLIVELWNVYNVNNYSINNKLMIIDKYA